MDARVPFTILSGAIPHRYVRLSSFSPHSDRLDRKTDRQTDRQTGGQTDRQTDRQTYRLDRLNRAYRLDRPRQTRQTD